MKQTIHEPLNPLLKQQRGPQAGDRADEHPLPRTPAQRSYDAFVAIMRNAVANHHAGRPASASEPLVTILTDHRTWGHILAEAGLAPDTTLAGEPVDPRTTSSASKTCWPVTD